MPARVDVIEQLYADGELDIIAALRLANSSAEGWALLGALLREQIATIALRDGSSIRTLQRWETDALLRSRLAGSKESEFPNDLLILRPSSRTAAAYHEEFGQWFEKSADSGGM